MQGKRRDNGRNKGVANLFCGRLDVGNWMRLS